jgi:hypothetical protein
MFGGARLLAARPCVGSGFRDRQSSEAGPHQGFLFRTAALPSGESRPQCGSRGRQWRHRAGGLMG